MINYDAYGSNPSYDAFEREYDPITYKARKLKHVRMLLLQDDWALNYFFFRKV
jgi:hypothetical protein